MSVEYAGVQVPNVSQIEVTQRRSTQPGDKHVVTYSVYCDPPDLPDFDEWRVRRLVVQNENDTTGQSADVDALALFRGRWRAGTGARFVFVLGVEYSE